MRVGAVIDDLMLFSRVDAAATKAGAAIFRASAPSELPLNLDLVLVDWSARDPTWVPRLRDLREAGTRVVLFGPHTDLDAKAAARESGHGPMWARSRLIHQLSALMAGETRVRS